MRDGDGLWTMDPTDNRQTPTLTLSPNNPTSKFTVFSYFSCRFVTSEDLTKFLFLILWVGMNEPRHQHFITTQLATYEHSR